jgi:hypothetical protein
MSDRHTVVNNYIVMWNETDARQRRELAAQVVTEDANYIDPLVTGDGIDGISAMIGGVQEQYPGHRFALVKARTTTMIGSGSAGRWRRTAERRSQSEPTS